MSNHWKRVNYSGEEKVAILRAHFVEGLLQEHVQRKKPMGTLESTSTMSIRWKAIDD